MSCNVYDVDEEKLYYQGDDLGLTYADHIQLKIWSPPAKSIEIVIYIDDNCKNELTRFPLNANNDGTWQVCFSNKYYGYYYRIALTKLDLEIMLVDPWVRAVGTNSKAGLIVNPAKIFPPGWQEDKRVNLANPVDAVLYELHVKDFSSSLTSGIENKGKYLAFTELNTTNESGQSSGIAHLKELGITHVHLLPVYDFATVDDLDCDDYNWGYDPYYYNVPEGSYAKNPRNLNRIYEFKKMVKSLHDAGIGVIMDVVFNHTFHTEESPFQLIFPDYFYRFNELGNFSNGSGVGNEIATERPMVRKFIIDSLVYWATEYHIDGFRFDLMGCMDKETIRQAATRLHDLDDSIILYGEPWTALPVQIEKEKQLLKGNQKGTGVAVFNDDFRHALKGDNDGGKKGYISGSFEYAKSIKKGVVGSINFSPAGFQSFASSPTETINYITCHDNLTLWDKLLRSNPGDNEFTRERMIRLAYTIIFTAQGIPFLNAGAEFHRTKFGDHNSYQSDILVNQLKWERKKTYYKQFLFLQGLIELRSHHPAFRMRTREQIENNIHFINSAEEVVAYWLGNHANGDGWEKIVVIYNPTHTWQQILLPEDRIWAIVVDQERASLEPIRIFKAGEVKIPPISAMIIYPPPLLPG